VALIRTRALAKSYGPVRALDGVDLEIGPGITGLLGANGAGKSTLLKLALGLLRPDSGSIEVLGTPASTPELRTRIGYAPEYACLPTAPTAAEFVSYMGEVSGLPRTVARSRASEMLRLVGLYEERHRPMGTFSTGMAQRVKVAQALVHDPDLVLFDEPTGGLDPLGRAEMLTLLGRVGHDFGISIVLSTHLLGDVERVCDAVVVLDGGHLLRSGPVESFQRETTALLVDLAEGADRVAAALAARGREPERTGNRLVLSPAHDGDLDLVRDAVVETGALLYRLAPGRAALSDVFDPAVATEGSP
jgi:ABC-2 type transport system ATP-binding protein